MKNETLEEEIRRRNDEIKDCKSKLYLIKEIDSEAIITTVGTWFIMAALASGPYMLFGIVSSLINIMFDTSINIMPFTSIGSWIVSIMFIVIFLWFFIIYVVACVSDLKRTQDKRKDLIKFHETWLAGKMVIEFELVNMVGKNTKIEKVVDSTYTLRNTVIHEIAKEHGLEIGNYDVPYDIGDCEISRLTINDKTKSPIHYFNVFIRY